MVRKCCLMRTTRDIRESSSSSGVVMGGILHTLLVEQHAAVRAVPDDPVPASTTELLVEGGAAGVAMRRAGPTVLLQILTSASRAVAIDHPVDCAAALGAPESWWEERHDDEGHERSSGGEARNQPPHGLARHERQSHAGEKEYDHRYPKTEKVSAPPAELRPECLTSRSRSLRVGVHGLAPRPGSEPSTGGPRLHWPRPPRP
jgi:hypothetical protein